MKSAFVVETPELRMPRHQILVLEIVLKYVLGSVSVRDHHVEAGKVLVQFQDRDTEPTRVRY